MNEIKKLSKKIQTLENKLKRSNEPARALSAVMRNDLDSQIVDLPALDFAEGGANDAGYSTVKVEHQTVNLSWVGEGVEYLEFGTGIKGANTPYPNQELMREHIYEPRINGHIHDTYWTLPSDYVDRHGEPIETCGWQPYKPMYNVRKNVLTGIYKPVVEKSIHDLMEKWL